MGQFLTHRETNLRYIFLNVFDPWILQPQLWLFSQVVSEFVRSKYVYCFVVKFLIQERWLYLSGGSEFHPHSIVMVYKFFSPRYLALEGLCLMSNSEFSADAVRKHQETVVGALKVNLSVVLSLQGLLVFFTLHWSVL